MVPTASEIHAFAARCLQLANKSLDRQVAIDLIQMAEDLTILAGKISARKYRPSNQEVAH